VTVMSDDELRERVAELEEWVRQLKQQNTGATSTTGNGLDHRDETVLAQLESGKEYHPRELVTLYQRHTDIADPNTAKNRAKRLRKRPGLWHGRVYEGRGESDV